MDAVDFDRIKEDVTLFLNENGVMGNIEFVFLEKRFFSHIYEIRCSKNYKSYVYILKISTTERRCKEEFEQYEYLQRLDVKSLEPIHYSDEFNYLITKKEELVSLDKLLGGKCASNLRKEYFYKLGKILNKIGLNSSTSKIFNELEFRDYVIPRINSSSDISGDERINIINKIEMLCAGLNDKFVKYCFVTDFSLGNIHVNSKEEIVLVDMGDATKGNHYENIAYIYLTIKFGPLAHYFDFGNKTPEYFKSFLRGYGIDKIDHDLFLLYRIRHLINMISFISSLRADSRNVIRRSLAYFSNLYLMYRYKNYLASIVSTTKSGNVDNE